MRVTVAGTGYVGLSIAVLLARQHQVIAYDIDQTRVDGINAGRAPIDDPLIAQHLPTLASNLSGTTDPGRAFSGADWVIIATPTNYDPETGHFDTRSVDSVIEQTLAVNRLATMVIKSTLPVGFTERARSRFGTDRLIFSPEFLREGWALHDNLHPSRIVVGDRSARGRSFAEMMQAAALKADIPVLLTDSTEAEAIKLFANTYLAMRVAFFNELDRHAATHGLYTKQIIQGVCLDLSIGSYYNNLSFGFGGYCLPKDTK